MANLLIHVVNDNWDISAVVTRCVQNLFQFVMWFADTRSKENTNLLQYGRCLLMDNDILEAQEHILLPEIFSANHHSTCHIDHMHALLFY